VRGWQPLLRGAWSGSRWPSNRPTYNVAIPYTCNSSRLLARLGRLFILGVFLSLTIEYAYFGMLEPKVCCDRVVDFRLVSTLYIEKMKYS
jgi:hypothetical protein